MRPVEILCASIEIMLIMNSCRLQRSEIVVVRMQLQAIRLRKTLSERGLEDQPAISSSASDLRLEL